MTGWTDTELITAIVAAYAAVVSTGALALEVRRWVESGPRLILTVMPLMHAMDQTGRSDDKEYLFARITNRGSLPTTLTTFALLTFRSIFHRWLLKANSSALVLRPVGGDPLPHVLAPGTEWGGSAIYDKHLRVLAQSGNLFVAIYSSHRKKPTLKKVQYPDITAISQSAGEGESASG